jgi:hypothetical protein
MKKTTPPVNANLKLIKGGAKKTSSQRLVHRYNLQLTVDFALFSANEILPSSPVAEKVGDIFNTAIAWALQEAANLDALLKTEHTSTKIRHISIDYGTLVQTGKEE